MSEKIEKSLLEIDFTALTAWKHTPSPAAWEDQVLYFLLVDRFSDGNERGGYRDNNGNPVQSGNTPLYTENDTDRVNHEGLVRRWRHLAGRNYQGVEEQVRLPE